TDRCGEEYGKCSDGLYCSKFGWCGIALDHCGIGCQSHFGNCDNNTTTSTTTSTTTTTTTTSSVQRLSSTLLPLVFIYSMYNINYYL
ncbi:hypothetical protein U3516DRAFT_536249, partial [Neocallimastix sp. 'constans']